MSAPVGYWRSVSTSSYGVCCVSASTRAEPCRALARRWFSYKDMPIADGSAVAGEGNNILFQGKPLMCFTGMGVKGRRQIAAM